MLLSRKTAYIFIALVAVGVIATAAWTVMGGTTLNLTLTSNPDLEDGLVGHWTMDGPDTVTNIADRSGQGNDGKLNLGSSGNTSTTTVIGRIGQALEFDGSDDYVDVSDVTNDINTSAGAISIWMNIDSIAESSAISYLEAGEEGNSNTFIGIRETNAPDIKARYRVGGTNYDAIFTSSPSDFMGDWKHLVMVWDTDNVYAYVDGVLIDSQARGTDTSGLTRTFIGTKAQEPEQDFWFDGQIDDTRIYDRALSSEEIERLYELGKSARVNTELSGPKTKKLIGHWTFDGGDMDTNVADASGSGNHGKLTDSRGTTTVIGRLGQALDLRTSNNVVDVGDTGQNARTVAFWMNPESDNENILKFQSGGSWFDSNYSFCRPFTMNSSQVATSTDPGMALVATSTIADLKHTDHGGDIQVLKEDDTNTPKQVPQDVVFTDGTDCNSDGGNKIDFFFEEYASTTGAFTAWVEPLNISSTTDKTILMYYGNSSATDQSSEAGVFDGDTGVQGVWNLHEDPSSAAAGDILDSTANNEDGTDRGGMDASDLVDGWVNGALDFDGDDDWIEGPDMTLMTSSNDDIIAASVWFKSSKTDYSNTQQGIIAKRDEFAFGITDEDDYTIATYGGNIDSLNCSSVDLDWHHLVYVYDEGADTGTIYVDGQQVCSGSLTDDSGNSGFDLHIGALQGGDSVRRFVAGNIDDMRIYTDNHLTDADVKTIYNNTADSSTFWTIGTEKTETTTAEVNSSSGSIATNGLSNTTTYVDGATGSSVTADTWQHVALTFDSVSADNVRLGDNSGGEFNGVLDDIRLYNHALSARAIERLYEMGKTTRINKTVNTNPDLERGLKGHWTFDGTNMDWTNSTAEARDRSGQDNHGDVTNFGNEGASIGALGQALDFDGDDDAVEVESNSSLEISDTITISAWVYLRSDNSNGRKIVCKFHCGSSSDVHYVLQAYPGKAFAAIDNNNASVDGNEVPLEEWHFLTMTYDGATLRIYNNGAETGSTSYSSTIETDTNPLMIGNNGSSGGGAGTDSTRNFDGKIDDVRIYDRALSEEEIERLHELGR